MPELPTTISVGIVGLGQIGSQIAARVAERYPVIAFDIDPRASLGEAVERADDLADLTRRCDIVLLSLPAASVSEQVVAELAAGEQPRAHTIVELSTVGPEAAERCAGVAEAAGFAFVDAPVSGGVRVAATGELAIMASAPPDALEAVLPVLEYVAKRVFVMGERPGLGQVMKLTNNVIALAALPITSEALTFGSSYGLTLADMVEVINASSGRTQRSEVMFPKCIIPGTFDYGAYGEITRKDVSLFVEEAERAGTPVRIASVVDQLYREFVETHPRTDYSYLHRFVEELAGRGESVEPDPHTP